MSITSQIYQNEKDHHRMMDFFRNSYTEKKNLENWLPPRFENNSREMDPDIRIWEKIEDGNMRIIGAAIPENKNQYFIQLHMNHVYLYPEIIQWIETHNKTKEPVKLAIISLTGNFEKDALLKKFGFKKGKIYGILRIRDLTLPIPDFQLPKGFMVRSVKLEDFEEIAKSIRTVFGHGAWFTREILETLAQASFYNPDLDLVVVDQNDRIVSFCTFRLDPQSRITELEPMGTLPEYRSLGIGRALLCEGLSRLKMYNPALLYIGGAANTPAANRLYELTGFTEKHYYYYWEKMT